MEILLPVLVQFCSSLAAILLPFLRQFAAVFLPIKLLQF
jgi:hypothetical protein